MPLLPPEYLAKKLIRPLPTKGGATLRTVACASNYMLGLVHAKGCARWRQAATLILEQAAVAAVSRQVHLALFYDAKLDIGAME